MTERNSTFEISKLEQIITTYGERPREQVQFFAGGLKKFMEENDAVDTAKLMHDRLFLRQGVEVDAAKNFLKGTLAQGTVTLALAIYADPEKADAQKRNELTWIKSFASSPEIGLTDVSTFTEKVLDLLPKKTLEEKLTSYVASCIKSSREKFKEWRKSSIKEKLKIPSQFTLGAVVGFVAADYAPELLNYIRNAHIGLALTRGAFEAASWTIASAERKYPRFAELSRKIATEKSVSHVVRQIGKFATKIQTHPAFLGFTAGILGHSVYKVATGNEQFIFGQPRLEASETPSPQSTPESLETPAAPTEASSSPEIPTTEPTIETPGEHITTPELTEPIAPEPLESIQTFEIKEYFVRSGDTLSEIVARFGGDPYGQDMTRTVLSSQDILLEQSRIGNDAARDLLDYLTNNPGVTWRQAINENLMDPKTGKKVSELFSEALRIIRPGDLFNIVAGGA